MQAPNVQQSATVLAALYQQITGLTVPAPLDLSGFVSTATTVLNLGLDKVHNALSTAGVTIQVNCSLINQRGWCALLYCINSHGM